MADDKESIKQNYLSTDSIALGIELIIAIGRKVRSCILDYALGAAVLGLIPVYGRWIPAIRLTLLVILNLKMIFNVGRFWGYHRRQGFLATVGCILAIVGSLALAIMVWLAVLAVGLFVPLIDSLARAAAYGVLTWSIGRTVSQYFYSPQFLDPLALDRAIQFHRSH